jgi:hypothetical protein
LPLPEWHPDPNWRPDDLDEVVEREEREEQLRKAALWGNVSDIVTKTLRRNNQHILSWLLTGATRAGKSTVLWFIAWLYHTMKFKIVVFDLPSTEGTNVCEAGFFALPMEKKHPLFKVVEKLHGGPKTVGVQIFRPYVYSEKMPVGLGVQDVNAKIPKNVVPFTIPLLSLTMRDWQCFLGELTPPHQMLLAYAMRGVTEETSIQDILVRITRLVGMTELEFIPDIEHMPKWVQSILIEAKGGDRRSLNKFVTGLTGLASSMLIMPAKDNGELVKTNINLKQVLSSKDWITFNFSPAIPTPTSFAIMRWLLLNILSSEEQDIAICIPEISIFAPRQLPEGREYFMAPMRELLRAVGSRQAKNGIIILGDTQFHERLEPDLLYGLRIRGVFAGNKADVETQIRERARNANEMIANINWILNETNHVWAFLPPGGKGYMIRASAVPPLNTHTTDKGPYDRVYRELYGESAMQSVWPIHQYLAEVVARANNRIRAQQDAEKEQKKKQDELKVSLTQLRIMEESLKNGTPSSENPNILVFLLKDWEKLMSNVTSLKRQTLSKKYRPELEAGVEPLAVQTAIAGPRKTEIHFLKDRLERRIGTLHRLRLEVGQGSSSDMTLLVPLSADTSKGNITELDSVPLDAPHQSTMTEGAEPTYSSLVTNKDSPKFLDNSPSPSENLDNILKLLKFVPDAEEARLLESIRIGSESGMKAREGGSILGCSARTADRVLKRLAKAQILRMDDSHKTHLYYVNNKLLDNPATTTRVLDKLESQSAQEPANLDSAEKFSSPKN